MKFKYSAGGPHTSEDPAAVHSALQKLLKFSAMQPNTDSTDPTVDEALHSSQEKIDLVVPTQHLFAWIGKHKEVLQKLLSEGQVVSASLPPLAMQK